MSRSRSLTVVLGCAVIAGMFVSVRPLHATETPAEVVEFFEAQVRPVLVEQCLACHGDKKQQGGLRLDTRGAMLKGNETGAAITPGDPSQSRLVQVLKYATDDIQMPPAGKLADEQIAAITKWVELGAPWPETDHPATGPAASSTSGPHWSFQPITAPPIPEVTGAARVQTSVDPFVLQRLEAQGLTLAEPADKATFIRRATFDLWGVPPTYEATQAFVQDTAADAVPRLIDRLLDSPLYGQRWARHWLDVARYADTKGYVFTEEPRYPYAYTYRDYVVDSLNHDKPYDRFILEQLAADQLDMGADKKDLAALGFLTVGRRFLNKREDIIDDRIDVVTRGLMSLTVTCARCHDHKYDPIPTADYYSLFGVFASCEEPGELPVIGSSESQEQYAVFERELKAREAKLAEYEQQTWREIHEKLRLDVPAYLSLVAEPQGENPREAAKALFGGEIRPRVIERWKSHLQTRRDPNDPLYGVWHQLIGKSGDEFTTALSEWLTLAATDAPLPLNARIRQALVRGQPKTRAEFGRHYGQAFVEAEQQWRDLKQQQPEATALPDPAAEELRQVLHADGGPTTLNAEEARRVYRRDERNKQRDLAKQIENLQATSPGAPPRAMVLNDKPTPDEPRILIRGNPGRPGDQVPRRFLAAVSFEERKPFSQGSGRLELARAIASPTNPLTARVIVNRVWQHHFGEGLVRSPGDFGVRGQAPTHPELLDHLATRFIQNGWSLKWLHRELMNSATYAQSSDDRPDCRTVDPENRLWWHKPRQRLTFEAQRDSWLAATGRLDTSLGGRPFEPITDPQARRRTIYAFVNRNDLPGVFRSFDFADVDVSMAERPETTVPQQALFTMNSPFVVEQAKQLAARVAGESDDAARVTALYRHALSRDPDSAEREAALHFVKSVRHDGQLTNWDKLAQILLLTNEFVFVD
jgi:mono/diheme cytochrome c family protein